MTILSPFIVSSLLLMLHIFNPYKSGFLLKDFFNIYFIFYLCLCVSVCGYGHMCVQVTVQPEKSFRSYVVGDTRVGELLDMNTELNLGSL